MATARASRQVRTLIDRASLTAAALLALLLLSALGLPVLPVVVFLLTGTLAYCAFQYVAQQLLGRAKRRAARRR